MNLQYLMYKHIRKETPYQSYIKQKLQIEQKKERILYYDEILKFRQSRYPQQLMSQLEREINPFQLSINKLKQFYNSKFPQYSNELVHEAVEFVFKRKCQQSAMVKESPLVIEYGEESIRNGRKLQKQDFSYFFEKSSKDRISNIQAQNQNTNTKEPVTDRSESPTSKIYQDIQAKTDRFNKLLMDQIKREKDKFQNIHIIQEGDPRDIIFEKAPNTDKDIGNQSFPKFKGDADMIVRPETGNETGRSDLQELNYLLGGLTVREEQDLGSVTGRSRGSSFAVKINKDVMDNLFNARGKLKLDLVRRVVGKLKKDKAN